MPKNLSLSLHIVSLALIAFLLFKTFAKKEEIVYINTTKLLSDYKGMKRAQKDLEKSQAGWRANLDTLQSELEQEIKKFEQQRPKLSPKEIELQEKALGGKQRQFLTYQDAMKKKAAEEEQKKKGVVAEDINAFLKEYGEAHAYKYILGATSLGNIVYADPVDGITDDVLKILNKKYKED
jgi:outer membrane protein